MFESLPEYFRNYHLKADVRTLLLLRKALSKGLVNTLGDLYLLLRGIIARNEKDYGPYTKAFYQYFLEIEIKAGERLEEAIMRSETFKRWVHEWEERYEGELPPIDQLVEQFLDQVHLTTFDIKKVLSGRDILDKDDPDMKDENEEGNMEEREEHHLVQLGADYTDIPLEELLERMKKVMDQQRARHSGGDHWIGSHGRSPYGHGGAAAGGIRVGGKGGGKMARMVVNSRQFYPVDTSAPLTDDNIDAALAALKGVTDESSEEVLDIPITIKTGIKQGGIFLPEMKEEIDRKIKVILLIDNGGFSMYPFIRQVQQLFGKMKTRFAHDLKVYYFHNTIHGGAFEDPARSRFVSTDQLLAHDPYYHVFVIGDAAMAPYELSASSRNDWLSLSKKYKRFAWLNPIPPNQWDFAMTTQWLREFLPMYPLTPKGIEHAVLEMNRKTKSTLTDQY